MRNERQPLTLGSLFDGSGTFPLGGLMAGIQSVWSSDVEPFPIRVTTKRMPFIKHYGDISQMRGGEIEPVDIITGGFPCQSVSVAGKRRGLKHIEHGDAETTRTGLFYEMIRIVKEMREATLMSRDYKDPAAVCCGIGRDVFNAGANAKFAPSIDDELQPPMTARGPGAVQQGYAVRRLTPTECARLQGFPDWWCSDLGTENPTAEEMEFWRDVFETHRKVVGTAKKPKTDNQIRKWLKNPHTDSAEYRMWGNGCYLGIVFYVLFGIAHFASHEEVEPCEPMKN